MATYQFKLPDIGEGIAEAEIVAWYAAKVGDQVEEDQQLADMMTDKATVEMESPVAGKVTKLAGEVGDQIAIGSVLVWRLKRRRGAGRAGGRESTEEQPLADGMTEPTLAQAEEIPVTATADAPTAPKAQALRRLDRNPEPRPLPSVHILAPLRRPPARPATSALTWRR